MTYFVRLQVQIWAPLGKDWLRSPHFMQSQAQFLVRLDFAPTAYVHSANQLSFPIALTTTNDVKDLTDTLRNSGDLF